MKKIEVILNDEAEFNTLSHDVDFVFPRKNYLMSFSINSTVIKDLQLVHSDTVVVTIENVSKKGLKK